MAPGAEGPGRGNALRLGRRALQPDEESGFQSQRNGKPLEGLRKSEPLSDLSSKQFSLAALCEWIQGGGKVDMGDQLEEAVVMGAGGQGDWD